MAVHAEPVPAHAHDDHHGPVSRGGGSPWLGAGWLRAFWVSAMFGGTAILITMLIRHLLGFPHPYSAEVAATEFDGMMRSRLWHVGAPGQGGAARVARRSPHRWPDAYA